MILEHIRLFLVQSFLVMFQKSGFFVFKIKDVIKECFVFRYPFVRYGGWCAGQA